jgi:ferredoxin--NADP+ reductase
MHKIVAKRELARKIKLIEVEASAVAEKAQAGQFVILRVDDKAERIPLTLADWDGPKGTLTLIFQEVGASTEKMGALNVGDEIMDVCGPLGNPSEVKKCGNVCVVGGGVGAAPALPIIKAMKKAGNRVVAIIAAKSADMLILEKETSQAADELYLSTDDGSKGQKCFACDMVKILLDQGHPFDIVYAIGPTVMMRTVADTTRPFNIKTIVSLNPIMVDGMGMCGACRVNVGGRTRFACVDGPEFDAHQVDFHELQERQAAFLNEEKQALQRLHAQMCTGHT